MRESSSLSSSAVWKWENAGESLANALSSYLRSCMFLEAFSSTDGVDAQQIALRIDFSLANLHTKLAEELTQSRVILSRMRNKTFTRFNSLPNEIIAAIFFNVVYDPSPDDPSHPPMGEALERMYGRLYTLLSVCVPWRNIGVELAELWAVIPMASSSGGLFTRAVTSLTLERSRASPLHVRPLHLAALLSPGYGSYLPLVDGELPRFTSINIECEYMGRISTLIAELLQHRSVLALHELSIRHVREEEKAESNPQPRDNLLTSYSSADLQLFKKLMSSLSVLRIRGANIQWGEISFSNKLVELRLQSVTFGDKSETIDFLSALASAKELQSLKVISVVTLVDTMEPIPLGSPGFILLFSKLQVLLLQDLDYTTLWILLGSILPGSHQTKLFLTPKSRRLYESGEEAEEDVEVGIHVLHALFRLSTVDTLVLDGNLEYTMWLNDAMLRRTLQSLPTLKNLKIGFWYLNTQSLRAIERPQVTTTNPNLESFPNLSTLCIIQGYIWDSEALSRVVASHSLKNMRLAGHIPNVAVDDDMTNFNPFDWDPLEDDDPIVRQLRVSVPDFQLVEDIWADEDFYQDVWKLW